MGNHAVAGHALNLCGCTDSDTGFSSSARLLINLNGIEAWNAKDLVRDNLARQLELAKRSPLKLIPVKDGLDFMRKQTANNWMNSISRTSASISKDQFIRVCTNLLSSHHGRGVPHTPKDIEELGDIFDSMDFDGNGSLSLGEWAGGLSVFFKGDADAAIRAVFQTLDTDKNGTLSKPELQEYLRPFVKAMSPPDADSLRALLLKKATQDIYKDMDRDTNGSIDAEEMIQWSKRGNDIVNRLADLIDKEVYNIILQERDKKKPGEKLGKRKTTEQAMMSSSRQRDMSQPFESQQAVGPPGADPQGYPGGAPPPQSGYQDQAGGWQQQGGQPGAWQQQPRGWQQPPSQQGWQQQQQPPPPQDTQGGFDMARWMPGYHPGSSSQERLEDHDRQAGFPPASPYGGSPPAPSGQYGGPPEAPSPYGGAPPGTSQYGGPPYGGGPPPGPQSQYGGAPPAPSSQYGAPPPSSSQYGGAPPSPAPQHRPQHSPPPPHYGGPPPAQPPARRGHAPDAPPPAGGDPFQRPEQRGVPPPPPPPNRGSATPQGAPPYGGQHGSAGGHYGGSTGHSGHYAAVPPPPPPPGHLSSAAPYAGNAGYAPGSGYGGYGHGVGQYGGY